MSQVRTIRRLYATNRGGKVSSVEVSAISLVWMVSK